MNTLVLVDSKNLFPEKALRNMVGVDDIKVVNDLETAKKMLHPDINGLHPAQILVISTLFIDKNLKEKELLEVGQFFPGAIVVRTDSDQEGLDLIKNGLISEYYLSSGDQIENMRKAVSHAMVVKRVLDRQVKMQKDLKYAEILQNLLLSVAK